MTTSDDVVAFSIAHRSWRREGGEHFVCPCGVWLNADLGSESSSFRERVWKGTMFRFQRVAGTRSITRTSSRKHCKRVELVSISTINSSPDGMEQERTVEHSSARKVQSRQCHHHTKKLVPVAKEVSEMWRHCGVPADTPPSPQGAPMMWWNQLQPTPSSFEEPQLCHSSFSCVFLLLCARSPLTPSEYRSSVGTRVLCVSVVNSNQKLHTPP